MDCVKRTVFEISPDLTIFAFPFRILKSTVPSHVSALIGGVVGTGVVIFFVVVVLAEKLVSTEARGLTHIISYDAYLAI